VIGDAVAGIGDAGLRKACNVGGPPERLPGSPAFAKATGATKPIPATALITDYESLITIAFSAMSRPRCGRRLRPWSRPWRRNTTVRSTQIAFVVTS